ncbi:MAG: hypothetical protein P8P98_03295 [Emcibacteraceae bacterium]|nr:hypothetical protein [Emcibacteraceae bacterium]MDG1997191.1 hypothetical protein [Emcibacteraceae bacterium]
MTETIKETVRLTIEGTESTIPAEELTIERIIAEAHAVGYQEFSVFCEEKEITKPDDLKIIPGANYLITPPESEFDMEALGIEVIEDDDNGA